MANQLMSLIGPGPLSWDLCALKGVLHSGISDHLPPSVRSVSASSLSAYDIVVDVRPYNEYIRGHLHGAVNICVPSTLLKRDSLSLKGILALASVASETKNAILKALAGKSPKLSILAYDQNLHQESFSLQLSQTIGKFHRHSDVFDLFYLEGGFQACAELGDAGISRTPLSDSELPTVTKPCLGLAGFELPSSSPCHYTFFQAMKETHNDSDPAPPHEMKFQYPAETSSDNILAKTQIPKWLRFVANTLNEKVIDELTLKFNKIEHLEQDILYTLATGAQSTAAQAKVPRQFAATLEKNLGSPLCPLAQDIDFSVPEGIEYGYKNRYKNVWPYEHTRVKLEGQKLHDDYFNGNHIDCGVPGKATYIATQNPLPATVDDFWRVVESQKVNFIISLNNLSLEYLHHSKHVSSTTVLFENKDTTVRLINDQLYHLEFKSWPDFGVPASFGALKSLIDAKNFLARNMDTVKTMVHCLAGCGRTGVFITIDLLIGYYALHPHEFNGSKEDLIYRVVKSQRTQRVSMVQNFAQYVSCYEMILNLLCDPHKSAPNATNLSDFFAD